MKRKLSVMAILCCSVLVYSQVGINTQAPQATLDVTAKNTNGTTPEGLIPPRLTGNQVQAADAQYGVNQRGAIIYVTSPVTSPGTKTANITSEGYYYFNGSLWQNLSVSSAPSLILPNYVNNGQGVNFNPNATSGWYYTGTSITLPANSRYAITVCNFITGGQMSSNQLVRVSTSFSDSATAFTYTPDMIGSKLISGTRTPISFYGEVKGSFIINNTSPNPKTYYYFVGQSSVQGGYNGTIQFFGGKVWDEDMIYALRVN